MKTRLQSITKHMPLLESRLVLGIFSIFFLFSVAPAQNAANYTLAVVPQLSRLTIYENWQPLLDYLSQEIGVNFELQVSDSIPLFEQDFLVGGPDFAFMNPYHQVMAKNAQGYIPLLCDDSRQLKGILVVREDSPYQSIQDLDGFELVFPAPNAFGASLYMRALLTEQENIQFKPSYVETHANTYRNVVLGKIAAGGGVMNTLSKESADLQAELRILYETPGVTTHPLSVHPRVSKEIREQVLHAVLALTETEEGQQILNSIQLKEPMPVDYDSHYQMLEELNLENYLVIEDKN